MKKTNAIRFESMHKLERRMDVIYRYIIFGGFGIMFLFCVIGLCSGSAFIRKYENPFAFLFVAVLVYAFSAVWFLNRVASYMNDAANRHYSWKQSIRIKFRIN